MPILLNCKEDLNFLVMKSDNIDKNITKYTFGIWYVKQNWPKVWGTMLSQVGLNMAPIRTVDADYAFTDSPNEVTYGCLLTALLISVNCIKIIIWPFKNHILAQNMKNRCTIMHNERFWYVKTGCCQRTNQYFTLVHLENASLCML